MEPDSVLLVTPCWTRNGGVAAHVNASAAALAQRGLRVGVLASEVDTSDSPPGVTVFHNSRLFDMHASLAQRLGSANAFDPQVIHLHQVDEPELIDGLRRRAPVASSVHTYVACSSGVHYFRPGHECTRGHGPGCVANLLARGCAHTRHPQRLPAAYRRASRARRALSQADLAISYSSAVDRHLATNGVQARAQVPLFSTLVTQTASGHATRRRVVFAGRLVAPKGVDVLLRAARLVDAEFVLCGEGWRAASLRDLTRRLGVEERVDFRGWLSGEALARELAEASVVALPSLWPEPFGLVGIEALAAGRPVVASATGGTGDWLVHGVTGLAVPAGDTRALARALTELLDDPERQHTLGQAGRELVATRFSATAHVAALIAAYRAAQRNWDATRQPRATSPRLPRR